MTFDVQAVLSELAHELSRKDSAYALKPCSSVAELFKDTGTAAPERRGGFVQNATLVVGRHFDLDVGILICDPALRTIGLVQVVEHSEATPTKPASSSTGDGAGGELQTDATPDSRVTELVDQAAYVRHLMLNEPAAFDGLAPAVELVLVVPPEPPECLARVQGTLRHLIRRTAHLHAIGVSILSPAAEVAPRFTPEQLRRAFSWLLTATRAWYGLERPAGTNDQSFSGLGKLHLSSYRLPGKWTWELAPEHKIHLVHGHNGSGKSSLVEALELALTGKVVRLGPDATPERLRSIVRNERACDEATIRLTDLAGHAKDDYIVGRCANGVFPEFSLPAASFRLDQGLMDRLVRNDDVERAKTFNAAFFSTEAAGYDSLDKARHEALNLLAELDPSAKVDPEKVAQYFKPLAEQFVWLKGATPPSPTQASVCLPPSVANHLDVLAALVPEFSSLQLTFNQSPPAATDMRLQLVGADEALARVRPTLGNIRADIESARVSLERLAGWETDAQALSEPYDVTLNRWLESCAVVDLAEKGQQLATTLADARVAGWSGDGSYAALTELLVTNPQLQELTAQIAQWRDERDRLRRTLLSVESGTAAGATGTTTERPHLSRAEQDALDRVGPRLLPTSSAPNSAPLGQAINAALSGSPPVAFGDALIGSRGWTQQLFERAGKLLVACEALAALPEKPFARRFDLLKQTVEAYDHLAQSGYEEVEKFKQLIASHGPLNAALNELLALFTPARWTYNDIALSHASQDGQHRLGLRTGAQGAVEAELRFNTAELNLFTVALFTLCAMRIDNPLRLLVLDDPLQNMDELTVTTLARGLGRLIHLQAWPAGWRMVFLFHGEDDLERFRREMPAAVYLLPWIGAGPQAKGVEIKADPDLSRKDADASFHSLFEDRAARSKADGTAR